VACIHVKDQLHPKRALPQICGVCDAICLPPACRIDPDFVIVGRSDACRFEGPQEVIDRIKLAAGAGADTGFVFPRNDEVLRHAPKLARVPLVHVMSRGNRDQRPLPTYQTATVPPVLPRVLKQP
jgi:methylisocitrate lyase